MNGDQPVLVLSNERDFAADRVVDLLHDSDVPVVRWNAETLGRDAQAWSPSDSGTFRSVWARQYISDVAPTDDVATADETLVIRSQWRTWAATLDAPGSLWVNPLWSSRRAENKVVQLRAASALGLRLPPTIITSNRDVAHEFRDRQPEGRAVVKSLSSGYFAHSDRSFMFTESLSDDLLTNPDEWAAQPLIVQRQIPRVHDIRVFVIDDLVTAAALPFSAVAEGAGVADWRLAPDRDWTRIHLAEDDADCYRALTRDLGLRYAAIDLVDDGCDLWFLELNQAGEFAFLDRPLQLGVAEALARTLARTK